MLFLLSRCTPWTIILLGYRNPECWHSGIQIWGSREIQKCVTWQSRNLESINSQTSKIIKSNSMAISLLGCPCISGGGKGVWLEVCFPWFFLRALSFSILWDFCSVAKTDKIKNTGNIGIPQVKSIRWSKSREQMLGTTILLPRSWHQGWFGTRQYGFFDLLQKPYLLHWKRVSANRD